MILVDTTVWVDFFSNRNKKQVEQLSQFIETGEEIYLCGIILTEILQGIRNPKEHKQIATLLQTLTFIEMSRDTFTLAADIYRSLRTRGITIRKTLDCMIAAVAISHQIPLLHNDRDYDPIVKYCGLKSVS